LKTGKTLDEPRKAKRKAKGAKCKPCSKWGPRAGIGPRDLVSKLEKGSILENY
jgi:hypothetical protein